MGEIREATAGGAPVNVLVTGHKGYIGSVMTPVLAKAGHSLTGVDTCYYESGALRRPPEDIRTLRMDIRDLTIEELHGYDVVIHLAGLSYDRLGELDRALTYEVNFQSSVRLAQLAREAGVKRFLFASSCSVYGMSGESALREESTLRPLSPYAESKARAEEAISKLSDPHFSPVSLRLASAYGYSPSFRTDLVLNSLVGWGSLTGKVRVMSDGTAWRPLTHIQDISQAVVALLQAPRATIHDQVFNVGVQNENYQVSELAAIVAGIVPGCVVEYAGDGGSDPRNYRVDFSKLSRQVPGCCPTWNVRLGAQELDKAYHRLGVRAEELQGPSYVRLERLKQLQSLRRLDSTFRWTKSRGRSGGPDGR